MRFFILSVTLFLFSSLTLFGQKLSNEEALQYIKTGNTLREAQQFERAENFLKIGLKSVEGRNQYWEASANEALGLLYRDLNEVEKSIIYLNRALKIYKKLRVATSIKAIESLLNGIEGKEDIYAGIEVGARGVKLSVIGVKINIEGFYEFHLIADDSENPLLVSMTDEAVEKTIEIVNRYIKEAKKTHKVSTDKVFVVGSSGVKAAAEKVNQLEQLTKKLNENFDGGYKIEFITPEQEAFLVIQGSTLRKYRAISSTIDIGSGNTKGGFVKGIGGELLNPAVFPYGTQTLAERINSKKLELNVTYDSAANILRREIQKEIEQIFSKNTGLNTRSIVHLVGGITWVMASYLYPSQTDEAYVRVSSNEIRKFREMAMYDYEKLTSPNLDNLVDEEIKLQALENIKLAKAGFSQDQVIAGATILETVVRQYETRPPKKRFLYARQGYIGWITGYIMGIVKDEYAQLTE